MVGLQKAEATELKCCEGFNDNYGTCSGGMCSTVQMIMNIGNKQKDQVKRQCVEEIGIPPGCIEDRPNERTVIKTCYCNTELCNAVGHGDLSTEGIVEGEHPCSAKRFEWEKEELLQEGSTSTSKTSTTANSVRGVFVLLALFLVCFAS
ncbi:hypothetical protein QR680_017306 [Steinernema hermaphroditum]|uniref:Uncharacterized protein n=1 Tax=Steinernema hermaphroditum TaxID=289476 RepID=A0AA39HG91_9BILA|nr:hypothetical protein QR680_017306 [Steinernema hermaphroditum]